jgi:hypothetical protein
MILLLLLLNLTVYGIPEDVFLESWGVFAEYHGSEIVHKDLQWMRN